MMSFRLSTCREDILFSPLLSTDLTINLRAMPRTAPAGRVLSPKTMVLSCGPRKWNLCCREEEKKTLVHLVTAKKGGGTQHTKNMKNK